MDVTPLITRDRKIIQSYKGGVFKISGEVFNHPIIVMPDRVLKWNVGNISSLQLDDLTMLKPYLSEIDVVLLGTGDRQIMLPSALRQAIKAEYGFTVEAMDTGAASRTYNVLLAEGRKVAVALT